MITINLMATDSMATGDVFITCAFCNQTYYLVNGHKCSVMPNMFIYTDNVSGPAIDDRIDRIEQKLDDLLRLLRRRDS